MSDTDGLKQPQLALAMASLCLGVVLTSMDSVVANIALPTIARDLHAAPAATVWVVTAFQLAVTVAILPLATLGERLGCRRVYLSGLALFVIASILCAISPNLDILVAARALQGLGGAGLISVSLALVRHIYPRQRLGRGLGLYATTVAISMASGPSIAAAILSVASWPALFAVNLPVGLTGIAIGIWSLPEIPRTATRFDAGAALTSAAVLALLVLGVDALGRAASRGQAAVELVLAAIIGTWLLRWQGRQKRPMVPVDLLRIGLFALSSATSVMSYAAALLAMVALPFYLQDMLGRGVTATGLLITPWPLGILVGAQATGRLSDRYPAGILGSIGLSVLTIALLLLGTMGNDASNLAIGLRTAAAGLGFGFFQTPNNRAMMTAGPLDRSGAASGMLGTVRLLGMSLGSAVAAVLLAAFGTQGAHLAMWVAAGIAAAGAMASVGRLRTNRQPVAGSD